MTDEVMQFLIEKSGEAVAAHNAEKERQAAEEARKKVLEEEKKQAIDDLVIKATANGRVFLKEVFKEMIDEYVKDPLSIGDNDEKRSHYMIIKVFRLDIPRESYYTYDAEKYAREYNHMPRDTEGNIEFIHYYNGKKDVDDIEKTMIKKKNSLTHHSDPGGFVQIPIKFNFERIRNYNIFSDFYQSGAYSDRITHPLNTRGFRISANYQAIRKLIVEASQDKLVRDDYLLDDEIIGVLKEAYKETLKKEKEMQNFTSLVCMYTGMLYMYTHEKLIDMYLKSPDEKLYTIEIAKELPTMDSEHHKKESEYNRTALVSENEHVFYVKAEGEKFEHEYVPIHSEYLKQLFDKHDKYGLIDYHEDWNKLEIKYDGAILTESLNKIWLEHNKASKNKKRKRIIKSKHKKD